MSEKIGLIGFVNTEEILADTIRLQSPHVTVDGYEVFPNEAFGRAVNNRYQLYGINERGDFGLHNLNLLESIKDKGYSAVNLGPIPAAMITEDTLLQSGIEYIGPRKNELAIELDKSKIVDIFPNEQRVIPPTIVLESATKRKLYGTIDSLGGDVVFKFVGEYPKYYQDSETRRVRMLDEFKDPNELSKFVENSIEASGRIVIQKKIEGTQFSYTCLVDGTEAVFRLGENICYKHRNEGDTGPLCDATGSISIDNSLPFLGEGELDYIKSSIVLPYCDYLRTHLGRAPQTFLNLDLIRDDNGKVYLLEVNNREPGGHTMANLLSGLLTPVTELMEATQNQRLCEVVPQYKKGASVVVSAYPQNFPFPLEDDAAYPVIEVPKLRAEDEVRAYTGWVDVEEDKKESVIVRSRLSPTIVLANHSRTLAESREKVYAQMGKIIVPRFDYRSDIGLWERK